MFEKNLTDLVRGIRNNKNGEARYIASCLDEIKQELKEGNAQVKANAVAKLTYLQMLGYDISWAAFNIIEVMSSSKFTFKRVGYLAASNSFHEGLDILMLTTNMIRKDLCSMQMYDAGIALTGFSCFVTPDLARDLANDVMNLIMMTVSSQKLVSTKPYIRKRAVLMMYKIFLKFPEALRPAFPRLKDKLEDPDPGVQSAAVNVICELARKNPKNYLSLAPLFFKLMTSSTNNWMLIKIIKLFGALCPLEPRLGKKLLEPLTNLIHSTSAMSLLYECINTVISGLPNHTSSIQLCVSKLRLLIEDPDQNLKYLGLLAMSQILKCQPKIVQTHKDLVMQCLDDKDESIRLRALDLINGMVTKKNLMEIGKKLLTQIEKADSQSYRDEILSTLIQICSQSNYQYVTNFEWYLDVLVQLSRVEGTRHGRLIAAQMMDVAIRVKAIRPYAVQSLSLLLDCNHLFTGSMVQKNGACEVLYAAAWVSGEFCDLLPDVESSLDALLKPKVTSLPGHIQAVYVQSICKLYSSLMNKAEKEGDDEDAKEFGQKLIERLPMFVQSADLEVQERASCILQLIKYVVKLQGKGVACGDEVGALFSGELNPVAPKAQKKVPVPDGLDLDKWINDPPSESSEGEQDLDAMFMDMEETVHRNLKQKDPEEDEEELARRREQRRQENLSNPHYLRLNTPTKPHKGDLEVDEIPVARLDLPVSLRVSEVDSKKYSKKGKRRRKGRKGHRDEDHYDGDMQKYEVLGTAEMPEGADESAGEEEKEPVHSVDDPHRLLNVDLERPLGQDDILPVRTHRVVSPSSKVTEEDQEPEEKKSKKHRHKYKKEKEGKHKHKKEKDRKERKSHHKHRHHQKQEEPEQNLMINGEDEPASEPGIPVSSTESTRVPPVTGPEADTTPTKHAADQAKSSQLDDMEFWLSNTDAQLPTSPQPSSASPVPTADSPAKSEKHVTPEREETKKTEKKEHKKKHRKDKKDRHGKENKKEKKRRTSENSDAAEPPAASLVTKEEEESPMIDITEEVAKAQEKFSTYRLLAENAAIKLTYETRVTPQSRNQVVASVIFRNLTEQHIKSMDFNVLDSLNTKLVRPIGSSSHDSVPVPFVLLPGCSNEGQFAFNVESIVMPQKLKGTLTYMIKDDQGSTSEKMDFKLSLPCSAFLIATPFSSKDFANLLGSGSLTDKQSVKVTVPEEMQFATVIAKICYMTHFAVVEQVDCNASLYACSIQGNHVCLLVKQLSGNVVTVDGKSTDSSLISNLLSEIKSLLQTA